MGGTEPIDDNVIMAIVDTYAAIAYVFEKAPGKCYGACHLTDEVIASRTTRVFNLTDAVQFTAGWTPRPILKEAARLIAASSLLSRELGELFLDWEELGHQDRQHQLDSRIVLRVNEVVRGEPALQNSPPWSGGTIVHLASWLVRNLAGARILAAIKGPIPGHEPLSGCGLFFQRERQLREARRQAAAALEPAAA